MREVALKRYGSLVFGDEMVDKHSEVKDVRLHLLKRVLH